MISTIHLLDNCGQDQYMNSLKAKYKDLEVVGTRKKRAREKETRVSPSRAPVLSFAHYFQAPATQAKNNETKRTFQNFGLGHKPFSGANET